MGIGANICLDTHSPLQGEGRLATCPPHSLYFCLKSPVLLPKFLQMVAHTRLWGHRMDAAPPLTPPGAKRLGRFL